MLWDIFCTVIDNHGDLGVCWRLCADLAARGERVRLWVDDAAALAWMAPQRPANVQVHTWAADTRFAPPGDVVVEAFGCDISAALAQWAAAEPTANASNSIAGNAYTAGVAGNFSSELAVQFTWINLEYLSAEPYAQRCHGLPSPVLAGPGAGRSKRFYYPGFTPGTGGLLREANLAQRQAAFDRTAWLASQGIALAPGERLLSLFCYEPAALPALLRALQQGGQPTRLLVTAGRAAQAVQAALQASHAAPAADSENNPQGAPDLRGALSISYLPYVSQEDFDHLLWACDLNFVRGEDSLVRALWAGKPLVWQVYPQSDGAHAAKLDAFLDWQHAPPSLCALQRCWNGLGRGAEHPDLPIAQCLAAWQANAEQARARLWAQPSLAEQLRQFVLKNR